MLAGKAPEQQKFLIADFVEGLRPADIPFRPSLPLRI